MDQLLETTQTEKIEAKPLHFIVHGVDLTPENELRLQAIQAVVDSSYLLAVWSEQTRVLDDDIALRKIYEDSLLLVKTLEEASVWVNTAFPQNMRPNRDKPDQDEVEIIPTRNAIEKAWKTLEAGRENPSNSVSVELTDESVISKRHALASLLHDIKTPISCAIQYSEMLLIPSGVDWSNDREEFLEVIKIKLKRIPPEYRERVADLLLEKKHKPLASNALSSAIEGVTSDKDSFKELAIGELLKSGASPDVVTTLQSLPINIEFKNTAGNELTTPFSDELIAIILKNMLSNSLKSVASRIKAGEALDEIKIKIEIRDVNGVREITCQDNGAGLALFDTQPDLSRKDFKEGDTSWKEGIKGHGEGMHSLLGRAKLADSQNDLYLRRSESPGWSNCEAVLQLHLMPSN